MSGQDDTIRVSRKRTTEMFKAAGLGPDGAELVVNALIAATPQEPSEEEIANVKLCGEYIAAGKSQEQPRRFTDEERRALKNAQAVYPVHNLGWAEDWAVLRDMRIEAEAFDPNWPS